MGTKLIWSTSTGLTPISREQGLTKRVHIKSHIKCPPTIRRKRSSISWSPTRSPMWRRRTWCRSRLPTSMVESTPKGSRHRRSRTRATMGSCGASTGFSCRTEGRRLYHTQRTMRMATKQRFVMREKHVLKFLNQTTTLARKVKCGCDNIQSTPNSHMAATDLHAQPYGNCHQKIYLKYV